MPLPRPRPNTSDHALIRLCACAKQRIRKCTRSRHRRPAHRFPPVVGAPEQTGPGTGPARSVQVPPRVTTVRMEASDVRAVVAGVGGGFGVAVQEEKDRVLENRDAFPQLAESDTPGGPAPRPSLRRLRVATRPAGRAERYIRGRQGGARRTGTAVVTVGPLRGQRQEIAKNGQLLPARFQSPVRNLLCIHRAGRRVKAQAARSQTARPSPPTLASDPAASAVNAGDRAYRHVHA